MTKKKRDRFSPHMVVPTMWLYALSFTIFIRRTCVAVGNGARARTPCWRRRWMLGGRPQDDLS